MFDGADVFNAHHRCVMGYISLVFLVGITCLAVVAVTNWPSRLIPLDDRDVCPQITMSTTLDELDACHERR